MTKALGFDVALGLPRSTSKIHLFPCLGLALYWTWVYSMMFGTQATDAFVLSMSIEKGLAFSIGVFGTMCISFLVVGVFSQKFAPILLSTKGALLFDVMRAAGSALYFYVALSQSDLVVDVVLAAVGGAIAGIGSACLLVQWGCVYSTTNQSSAISSASLSFILALVLYYLVYGYASPIIIIVILILVPLVESIFLMLSLHARHTVIVEPSKQTIDNTGFFTIKNAILAIILGFTLSIFRELSVTSLPINTGDATQVVILVGVLALAFFLIQLLLFSEKGNLGKYGLRIPLAFVALTVVLLFVIRDESNLLYILAESACSISFEVAVWAALVWAVYKHNMSPIKVFGLGLGFIHIGQFLSPLSNGFLSISSSTVSLSELVEPLILMFALMVSMVLISKEKTDEEITEPTLTQASSGTNSEAFIEPAAIDNFARCYLLTSRETEVVTLLCAGRDVVNISKKLFISENTTKTHIKRIYTKTGVHSRQKLMDLIEETIDALPKE